MAWPRFDLPLLHTLLAAADSGGLVRAAARVGLTPSAVSLQMRRLEDQAGCALFRRQGRRAALTPAGERLVSYARRLLQLDEEAHAALREDAEAGVVRVGAPQDVAERWLPAVLARFARSRPRVRLEVVVDRSVILRSALAQGRLDVALTFGEEEPSGPTLLGELPMAWLASPALARPPRGEPVPLVLFDPPCGFRAAALAALDHARLPWRLALASPSLSVLWAGTAAGLGVTARTPLGAPAALRSAGSRLRLPPLDPVRLWLLRASDGAAPAALAALLEEEVGERLARLRGGPAPRGDAPCGARLTCTFR